MTVTLICPHCFARIPEWDYDEHIATCDKLNKTEKEPNMKKRREKKK